MVHLLAQTYELSITILFVFIHEMTRHWCKCGNSVTWGQEVVYGGLSWFKNGFEQKTVRVLTSQGSYSSTCSQWTAGGRSRRPSHPTQRTIDTCQLTRQLVCAELWWSINTLAEEEQLTALWVTKQGLHFTLCVCVCNSGRGREMCSFNDAFKLFNVIHLPKLQL